MFTKQVQTGHMETIAFYAKQDIIQYTELTYSYHDKRPTREFVNGKCWCGTSMCSRTLPVDADAGGDGDAGGPAEVEEEELVHLSESESCQSDSFNVNSDAVSDHGH